MHSQMSAGATRLWTSVREENSWGSRANARSPAEIIEGGHAYIFCESSLGL